VPVIVAACQGTFQTRVATFIVHPHSELGTLAFSYDACLEALVYYVPEVLDDAGITDEGEQLLANMGTSAKLLLAAK
jgi:hypothetical protein